VGPQSGSTLGPVDVTLTGPPKSNAQNEGSIKMIGRTDRYRIEIFLLQQFTIVDVFFCFGGNLGCFIQSLFVDIAS
jgi:hypothetical protein